MEAASTTKLLTEGTSLALLGPDFRWTTPVYRTGPVVDGVLHGDLVLVASGDPNFSQRIQPDGTMVFENEDHSYDGNYDTRAVPGDPLAVLRQLAAQVRAHGDSRNRRTRRRGCVTVRRRGSRAGTGAVVSPIVVNDNLVDVTVTPGAHAGDPVTPCGVAANSVRALSFPLPAPALPAPNQRSIFRTIDWKRTARIPITVTGTMPAGKPILFAYRVPHPQAFAQMAFAIALRDDGCRRRTCRTRRRPFDHATAAASYVPANIVASHVSPPLSQDVYVTLKVSDNLHAALMPYMWAIYVAHAHTDLLKAAFEQRTRVLKQRRVWTSMRLHRSKTDLGTFAFFTPRFMVSYLAWAARQPWFARYFTDCRR